jgi:transcriptional regulator with XRE-family HTH domain
MTDPSPGALGRIIQQRRRALGLSQEALAARASSDDDEVRQSDISRIELGKVHLPRLPRLTRLAAALDCSAAELLMAAVAPLELPACPAAPCSVAPVRHPVVLAPRPAACPRRALWRPTRPPTVVIARPDWEAALARMALAHRAIQQSQALLADTA